MDSTRVLVLNNQPVCSSDVVRTRWKRVSTRYDLTRGVNERLRLCFAFACRFRGEFLSLVLEREEGVVPSRRAGSVPVGWLVNAADRSAGIEEHTRTSPLDIYLFVGSD